MDLASIDKAEMVLPNATGHSLPATYDEFKRLSSQKKRPTPSIVTRLKITFMGTDSAHRRRLSVIRKPVTTEYERHSDRYQKAETVAFSSSIRINHRLNFLLPLSILNITDNVGSGNSPVQNNWLCISVGWKKWPELYNFSFIAALVSSGPERQVEE